MTVAVVIDEAATRRAHDAGENAWWRYLTEVLDHVRLPYVRLNTPTSLDDVSVLVFATTPRLDQETRDAVAAWVSRGGVLVTVGDPGDLSAVAGAVAGDLLDHAHVKIVPGEIWTDVPDARLHAIGGVPLDVTDADIHARWKDGRPAITTRRHGAGVALACGVDLWQSIVRIQQGYPVTADGVPAADGTAPIDDGILKCDDGLALSFAEDRRLPPGEPELTGPFDHTFPPSAAAPMFHRPHADLWRSVFLQCVWWAAEYAGVALPWLFYWPAGVPAVAHLSHDSDHNADEHAAAALDTFREADVKVTWCHVFPGGYAPETYARITAAGHENALHYNAMGDADLARWGFAFMRAQYAWAQAVTGTEKIVSNKNHYTRWEGWTEFYEWCERLGVRVEQSRGGSKQGDIGFLFGTAHLSFPMASAADGNRYLDVLVLPKHTQDLAFAAHESVRDVILDAALAQHGVAHFLFHGTHLHLRPPARRACLALADAARRRGMEWWTSAELNDWERARRGLTVSAATKGDGWVVRATAGRPLPNASVLLTVPGLDPNARPHTTDGTADLVRRHGRLFVELQVDIEAGDNEWFLTVNR